MDFSKPEYDSDITIGGKKYGHALVDLKPETGEFIQKVTFEKSYFEGMGKIGISLDHNLSVVGLLAFGASKVKTPWIQKIAKGAIAWISKTEESAFTSRMDIAQEVQPASETAPQQPGV